MSCKRSNYELESVKQINISESLAKGKKVLLSSIAEDIRYIKLQTDSACLLGRIDIPISKIKTHNNRIFISDEKRILVFDTTGKYISQIGSTGRGPGEYISPDDFDILHESNKIAVFSKPSKRVLLYNFNGIFESEINIEFYPTRMISFNNKLVFVTPPGRRQLTDYFTLTVIDEFGVIHHRLLERNNEKEINKRKEISLRANSFQIYNLDGSLYYYEKLYDTIWRISTDYKVDERFHYYYGDERRTIRDIVQDPRRRESSSEEIIEEALNLIIPQWYIDSHRFMFFRIVSKGELMHIVFDKKTEQSSSLFFLSDSDSHLNFSFFNDVDGGLPFWPTGSINGNEVFRLINSVELKAFLSKTSESFQSYPQEKRDPLIKIISNAEINDNPVLMIVALKN